MEISGEPFTVAVRPPLSAQPPAPVNSATPRDNSLLDKLQVESLMLNIDASLRVHSPHQFFTWTQGLLRNLVRHELLVCALSKTGAGSDLVESYATSAADPALFSDLFRRDTSLVPHLVRAWQENDFQPVICDTGGASPFAKDALARELGHIGANAVLAHGTYDAFGKAASFFAFACDAESIGPTQAYLAELIVPFLHLAWLRTRILRPAESAAAGSPGGRILTPRESEILKWIHIGKSNIEIGAILGISPLTVKNHVQKILRKLNARNRAQAVGKGLALRILSP